MIVFIVIVVIIVVLFITKDCNSIPKKIWTFNKYNKVEYKDYETTVLTKKNFFNYINIPVEISSHPNFNLHFSDLVCIYAMAEFGGIWIDSEVPKVPTPLFTKYEFLGMTKNGILQKSFFACNKGSTFVKLWRDEFIKIASFPNVEKYVESLKRETTVENMENVLVLSAQKVLETYPKNSLIFTDM